MLTVTRENPQAFTREAFTYFFYFIYSFFIFVRGEEWGEGEHYNMYYFVSVKLNAKDTFIDSRRRKELQNESDISKFWEKILINFWGHHRKWTQGLQGSFRIQSLNRYRHFNFKTRLLNISHQHLLKIKNYGVHNVSWMPLLELLEYTTPSTLPFGRPSRSADICYHKLKSISKAGIRVNTKINLFKALLITAITRVASIEDGILSKSAFRSKLLKSLSEFLVPQISPHAFISSRILCWTPTLSMMCISSLQWG